MAGLSEHPRATGGGSRAVERAARRRDPADGPLPVDRDDEHSYGGTAPDDELVAAQLRACAFGLAAGFGAETRLAFVRIALESGWNDALHVLPDGEEKTRLRADYADSPYGPP